MEKDTKEKEALIITEEILKIIAEPNNHFSENIREYICEKLDISNDVLKNTLDIITKIEEEKN